MWGARVLCFSLSPPAGLGLRTLAAWLCNMWISFISIRLSPGYSCHLSVPAPGTAMRLHGLIWRLCLPISAAKKAVCLPPTGFAVALSNKNLVHPPNGSCVMTPAMVHGQRSPLSAFTHSSMISVAGVFMANVLWLYAPFISGSVALWLYGLCVNALWHCCHHLVSIS
jgi:hypothetical protein